MQIERLTPHIGARVSGIDLATVELSQREEFRSLLEEHLVLFFTGQALDLYAYKRFGEVIGELEVSPLLSGMEGDLASIQIIEAPPGATRGSYADRWHTDVPFKERPSYASILRPERLPSVGGDTLWASMYAAYEMMSEPLRRLADDLQIVQSTAPAKSGLEFTHPAVRIHPKTGRRALYINSLFSKRVVGVSEAESAKLIQLFCEIATPPDIQVRYRWTPDSVAIWDNRFTQHYAVADYSEPRRMQRMTVVGEPVIGARTASPASSG